MDGWEQYWYKRSIDDLRLVRWTPVNFYEWILEEFYWPNTPLVFQNGL